MLSAMLLLGPTGSGKTPLGILLEQKGYGRSRCVHLDFSERLHYLARCRNPGIGLSPDDFALISNVLDSGALLEDSEFSLVRRIVEWFLQTKQVMPNDIVVLNGLPEHIQQGERISRLLCVTTVVSLECTAEVVVQRMQLNADKKPAVLNDGEFHAIVNKLCICEEQTPQLTEYFRKKGSVIRPVMVQAETTAEEILDEIRPSDERWLARKMPVVRFPRPVINSFHRSRHHDLSS